MSPGRDAEFSEMLAEYRAARETDVYSGHQEIAWQGYSAYFELLRRMQPGGYPTPDIVPMDSYFIEIDGQMLGELYIRHRLSPRLENIGGHVGYRVRPLARKRGVATAALTVALLRLAEIGIERALLTCDETNVASAKVIEKCGGLRIDNAAVDGRSVRRYWVPTGLPKRMA